MLNIVIVRIMFIYWVYYTGESSFEVKIEADSDDITEHPRDDKPRPYLCTVCDKRFTRKDSLNIHKQIHTMDKLYSCTCLLYTSDAADE